MLRLEQAAATVHRQKQECQYYDFIVIGSGISGVQAAEILALEGRSVIILEANDYIGGRIRTEAVASLPEAAECSWIRKNPKLQSAWVEHGATWLSQEHTYALRWARELGLTLFQQYNDGLTVYGRKQDCYIEIDNLSQVYMSHKKEILQVLNAVSTLNGNLQQLSRQAASNPSNPLYQRMYSDYIQIYDNMTVRSFLEKYIDDRILLELIMHTIEVEECISCDTLSVYHIISSNDYSLENLKVYLGLESDPTDVLKVREGFASIVFGILKRAEQHLKRTGLVRVSEPVLEIHNESGRTELEVVTSRSRYRCLQVIWSVPLATSSLIKVSRLSESKRMLFANQESANAVKLFLVFKRAFWRSRFCGNAYFSEDFPFSELMQVSPASLSCGILAFFFCADKINQWEKRFGSGVASKETYERKKQYAIKVIADMFLEGDLNSPELQDVVMAERSYRHNKYIKSCYQSMSKLGLVAEIESKFLDSNDCKIRDEYGIIFIGSELGGQHSTYVQGAIRVTRQKIYQYLSKADPWSKTN